MPTSEEISQFIDKIRSDIKGKGYFLNPNEEDLGMVIEGLLFNNETLGYLCCPCRAPAGDVEKDKDIVCPCDYMYEDVAEHGSCYCALYVNEAISKGEQEAASIPERRKVAASGKMKVSPAHEKMGVPINVWRCTVCGYLCAKDQPPAKCPICGVPKERFELFISA